MGVHVACKNEEEPIKSEGLWVKSMGIFQDAQGQLTHSSLVRSC